MIGYFISKLGFPYSKKKNENENVTVDLYPLSEGYVNPVLESKPTA